MDEFRVGELNFLFSWTRPYLKQGGHLSRKWSDYLGLRNSCFLLFDGFCFLLRENVSNFLVGVIEFSSRISFWSVTFFLLDWELFPPQLHLLLLPCLYKWEKTFLQSPKSLVWITTFWQARVAVPTVWHWKSLLSAVSSSHLVTQQFLFLAAWNPQGEKSQISGAELADP